MKRRLCCAGCRREPSAQGRSTLRAHQPRWGHNDASWPVQQARFGTVGDRTRSADQTLPPATCALTCGIDKLVVVAHLTWASPEAYANNAPGACLRGRRHSGA